VFEESVEEDVSGGDWVAVSGGSCVGGDVPFEEKDGVGAFGAEADEAGGEAASAFGGEEVA
jgi:hypothetical protein